MKKKKTKHKTTAEETEEIRNTRKRSMEVGRQVENQEP